ncbi:DUF4148 domain-containing protein [Pollutimonas harenae]|uniref:DUF4148 domain-containing protein n=1 Tax=Pollutimonas harenae TaxID=657015 RepID=A0A853H8L9_9BURK|nr:DUF4148 domain-containing protein [Pollutimonas harenae]NYT86394.1 DUF4148 domain-containing protein [Pollutimonas harenae]TEA69852.1 DUF4148 domain-containing protein [Pollutimonas harenae]
MTRTQVSAIAFAFSALFAGQAMAANTNATLTRDQVRAELADAVRTGNIVTGESSARLNEQFPALYPEQQTHSTVTRTQVQAELADAIRSGNIVVGESSAKLNEQFPNQYAQQDVDSKTRAEVRTELAEAAAHGWFDRHIEA